MVCFQFRRKRSQQRCQKTPKNCWGLESSILFTLTASRCGWTSGAMMLQKAVSMVTTGTKPRCRRKVRAQKRHWFQPAACWGTSMTKLGEWSCSRCSVSLVFLVLSYVCLFGFVNVETFFFPLTLCILFSFIHFFFMHSFIVLFWISLKVISMTHLLPWYMISTVVWSVCRFCIKNDNPLAS